MNDYQCWLDNQKRHIALKKSRVLRDLRGRILIDAPICQVRINTGYARTFSEAFYQLAAIYERQLRELYQYEKNKG